MTDRLGQQLGNYKLLRLIGRGGFSEVYLGEHVYLKTQVAIKVLQAVADDAREAFLTEARTIAGLVHPNIVRVLEFGIGGEDFAPFLVMDYAPRGTLRQRFTRGVRLPLEIIVHYVKQAASALQYAHHMNIIHRDVKPENMLLGVDDQLLLSDFGIAVVSHNTSPSQNVQEIVGTVQYMAPEQFEGKPRPASDQYALGLIVYEWLCGRSLVQGSFSEVAMQRLLVSPIPPSEREASIPAAVDSIVLKSLARDPRDRFPTIQMFADALGEVSKMQEGWSEVESITLTRDIEETITKPLASREKTQIPDQTTLPFKDLPQQVPAQQRCPYCGAMTESKGKFCLQCGNYLSEVFSRTDEKEHPFDIGASVAGSSVLGSFLRPGSSGTQQEPQEIAQIVNDEHERLQEYLTDDNATISMSDESLVNSSILSPATSSQVLLEVGDKYFEEKRYEESLVIYERIIQRDSQNIIAYLHKGRVLLALEKYEEVIVVYDVALRLVPTDANLWVAKGKLYWQLKRYKNALDAYEHAIQSASEDAAIWASKGEILWRLRRYDDALISYDRALALRPEEIANWISKGQLLIKLKHYEKALEVYNHILSVNPNDGRMWAIKGNILARLEHYEEALFDYDRALATFPKRASIWEARGEALSHLERYEEALLAFERALAFKPQDSSISHKRDMVYQLKQKKEELALKEKLGKVQAGDPAETRIGGRTVITSMGDDRLPSHSLDDTGASDYYDVFLSHSHVDAEWVETVLARRLEDEYQLRVWLDKWVLIPGQSWQHDMARGLHSARACAVCIGENTPLGWFKEEIERALDRQTKIPSFNVIPVLLPNAKTINVDNFLELRTRVDFRTTDYDQAFYLLMCGVKGIRPGRPRTERTTAKPGTVTEDMLQELKDFKQKGLLAETIADDYTKIIMEKVWIPQWLKEEDTHG